MKSLVEMFRLWRVAELKLSPLASCFLLLHQKKATKEKATPSSLVHSLNGVG
jgi:hypothetical protein